MLNIVIPLAGRGERFARAGYAAPKPLIPVHGVPMVEVVIRNVRPRRPHRFIFIALREHLERHELGTTLERACPGCLILPLSGVTAGAAATVLETRDRIVPGEPLMVVNGDQWVDLDIEAYLDVIDSDSSDGLILTMRARDPKWSYALCDPQGRVVKVAEKEVISEEATAGIYNFRRGRDFIRGAMQMISKDLRVKGEFYVAPVFNELIAWGRRIVTHRIGEVGEKMFGLGTPEDLEAFLRHPISRKAAGGRIQDGEPR